MPPYVRVLVWLAKPVPFGRAMIVYFPACAAPWKGAQPGAEERAKTKGLNQAQKRESQERGAQPGAEERAKTKGLNQAQKGPRRLHISSFVRSPFVRSLPFPFRGGAGGEV